MKNNNNSKKDLIFTKELIIVMDSGITQPFIQTVMIK